MRVADIEAVFGALNDADVKYLLVGGLAVIAHGYVRLTQDIDIVLQLDQDNVGRAMRAFEQIGYRPLVPVKLTDFADDHIRQSWKEEKGMVVFQLVSDSHASAPVDIFVDEPFPFLNAYQRARVEEVAGAHVPVIPYEELIELKRASGRPKDLLDIEHLETIQANRSTI